uniref:Uncharacterized protein n=1 Tax=Cacopsylla melanoneura TaxID=428564 RepID=A0A8D8LYA7_9HEMI
MAKRGAACLRSNDVACMLNLSICRFLKLLYCDSTLRVPSLHHSAISGSLGDSDGQIPGYLFIFGVNIRGKYPGVYPKSGILSVFSIFTATIVHFPPNDIISRLDWNSSRNYSILQTLLNIYFRQTFFNNKK